MNPLSIHHAYALQGQKEEVLPNLLKFLKNDFKVTTKNNPDLFLQEFETFSIDDSRELQNKHLIRSISGKKIFIIITRFITSEAQNALLKIFEEPSEGSYFYLILPNVNVLLPTLRSRLFVINKNNQKEIDSVAIKFMRASSTVRLTIVKAIIEEKDKGKAIDFVSDLEKNLETKLLKQVGAEKIKTAKSLDEILLVKKYLHDRAPSIKLLLESLCIVLV